MILPKNGLNRNGRPISSRHLRKVVSSLWLLALLVICGTAQAQILIIPVAGLAPLSGDVVIAYPNPVSVSSGLTITSHEGVDIVSIDVRDIDGNLIFSREYEANASWSVEDMSAGIYHITVNTSDGLKSKTVVVN